MRKNSNFMFIYGSKPELKTTENDERGPSIYNTDWAGGGGGVGGLYKEES